MNAIKSDDPEQYIVPKHRSVEEEDAVIADAINILTRRMYTRVPNSIKSPADAARLAQLKLAGHRNEVFGILFLDNRNRLIQWEELFHGTIDASAVYARRVVQCVLEHNAAAVILAHNHPSGVTTPSQSDIDITKRIREALHYVDCRVLDHIIVGENTHSMAEYGEI